jgi:asparagine synthase (glutamine-hydrolysing)
LSGIAIVLRKDGVPLAPQLVEAMVSALNDWGPDGSATWQGEGVAMCQAMLRTTKEAQEELQPWHSEDGQLTLVMDGYLTNWEELRRELVERGAMLRDRSDAELVLHAYDAWGEECCRHLDGEFAFALWDARRGELFCAKDHQGLRPLFIWQDENMVLIASSIAAIMSAIPNPPSLNHGYLAELLTLRWSSPDETFWHGITRIPAAHWLRMSRAGLHTSQYWQLPTDIRITYKRDEDYFEHYRALLTDCVRRSSRSLGPLACQVSGGLDSSSIYCLAHQLHAQDKLLAPQVQAYTLAGPEGSDADELRYVRDIARENGVTIHEDPLWIPPLDWYAETLERDRDLPPFPNGAITIGMTRRMVEDGSRVVLSGLGGDQWLDGTGFYYAQMLRSMQTGALWHAIERDRSAFGTRRAARMMVHYGIIPLLPPVLRRGLRTAKRAIAKPAPEAESGLQLVPEMEKELALREERYRTSLPADRLAAAKHQKFGHPYFTMQYDVTARQMANLGIEMRFPMHQRSFIEFSTTTPEHIRQRGGVRKFIHREAMRGILPDSIVRRRGKAEFSQAYFQQAEALEDFCATDKPQSLAKIADVADALTILEDFCVSPIDSESTQKVWAIYLICLILGQFDADLGGAPQESKQEDAQSNGSKEAL